MILLGFLAALGSGLGSNGNNINYQMDGSEFQNMPFIATPFASTDLAEILPVIGAMAAGALCFAIILGIALWVLRLTAEAGMIDAASRLDAGQKSTFGEAMRAGWSKIWNMIALDLLVFGAVFLTIMFFIFLVVLTAGGSAAAFAGGASSGEDFWAPLAGLGIGLIGLICCMVCGLIILFILIGVITTFTRRAIVLEDRGVVEAIKRAWEIIRANLGEVIILLILFFALSIIVGLVTAAVALPIGALAVAPSAARLFAGEALSALDVILMVIGGLALIVIIAAIRSIYTAFESSAYTLAFQEFSDKQLPEAKVIE
jgi:hypothetical protein